MWLIARVIKCTLILQGVPPTKFGRVKKRPKFSAIFDNTVDFDHKYLRKFQFYDIRQCYLDKLACAVNDCDWSCATDAADIDIDEAYSLFLANVQRLIQQTIAYPAIKSH